MPPRDAAAGYGRPAFTRDDEAGLVSSVSPTQAGQLSVCGAARPFLSSYTKNQFARHVPRVEIPLQCRERVRVTNLPTPAFISSGGAMSANPATWATPSSFGDVTLRRIGSHVDVSGDIKDNVSLVQSVTCPPGSKTVSI